MSANNNVEYPTPHTDQSRAAAFVDALRVELESSRRRLAGAVGAAKAEAENHIKLVEAEIAHHSKVAASKPAGA